MCIQNIYSFSVTEADCIEAVRITVALIEFLLLVTRLFALNKGNYRFSWTGDATVRKVCDTSELWVLQQSLQPICCWKEQCWRLQINPLLAMKTFKFSFFLVNCCLMTNDKWQILFKTCCLYFLSTYTILLTHCKLFSRFFLLCFDFLRNLLSSKIISVNIIIEGLKGTITSIDIKCFMKKHKKNSDFGQPNRQSFCSRFQIWFPLMN